MKKLFTVILISLWTLQVYSQTVKTEYYDPYAKTKVMAKYQVNSVGEKNGWFKGYDQQGVLVYEYNYKNNQFEGVNKEYVTYSGSRTLAQVETYKGGLLHGEATYYAKGNRVMSKGSYLNGEKHGKWSYENPFDSYGFSEEDKKGAKYLKFETLYDNGKEIHPDGEEKIYYSPSGKVYSVSKYLGGKKNGEWTYYFPNGDVKATETYNEDGKMILSKYYYPNGKLKALKDWRNGTYYEESFDENGNPDEYTVLAREKREGVAKAVEAFESGDFIKAKELFKAADSKEDVITMEHLISAQEFYKQEKYHEALAKIKVAKQRTSNPKIEDYYNKVYSDYIKWLDTNFDTWAQSYDAKTMNAWLPSMKADLTSNDYQKFETQTKETEDRYKKIQDLDGKMKLAFESLSITTYSKFKLALIEKAKPVIEKYSEEYALELTFDGMMQKGQKVIDAINKVINYTDDESKEFSKQLKNIDDLEQIRTILKI